MRLSRRFAEHGIWWSSQNLHERDKHASILTHGRGWLRLGQSGGSFRTLGLEWRLGRWQGFAAEVTVEPDWEHTVTVRVQWPFLALYGFLEGVDWLRRVINRRVKGYEGRRSGFTMHSGDLWWQVWHPTMSWEAGTPAWRHGNFDPMRFVFGKERVEREESEPEAITIPLPEGTYPATFHWLMLSKKRRRWPFGWHRWRLAEIDLDRNNVPAFPGKGENSWDMGDDAIFSLTTGRARTVSDAIGVYVASVLESRERYGGKHYVGKRLE